MKKNKISASILGADLANIEQEVIKVCKAGVDSIHLDIMDGVFVPNITFGPSLVSRIKEISTVPIKTHLMIKDPKDFVDKFINAGSETIIFHYESEIHCDKLVEYIKTKNVKVGISLLPSTNESVLKYLYDKLNEILIMTVNPGFGGQTFLENQVKKIRNVKKSTAHMKNIDIGVDGGINPITLKRCVKNGANLGVVGSYIFNSYDYTQTVLELRKSFF